MNRPLSALITTVGFLAAATADAEQFRVQGGGSLKWFGLKIYDAKLLTPQPVGSPELFQSPFALELTYARAFTRDKIAERSLEEIRRLRLGSPSQHQQWLAQMNAVFPNVQANDRLRGVHRPGQGVQFYLNDRRIGSIDDPEFSRAFFSIWFDPKTAEPGLRASLFGAQASRSP